MAVDCSSIYDRNNSLAENKKNIGGSKLAVEQKNIKISIKTKFQQNENDQK